MNKNKDKLKDLIDRYGFSEEEFGKIEKYIDRIGEFRKKFLQPKASKNK